MTNRPKCKNTGTSLVIFIKIWRNLANGVHSNYFHLLGLNLYLLLEWRSLEYLLNVIGSGVIGKCCNLNIIEIKFWFFCMYVCCIRWFLFNLLHDYIDKVPVLLFKAHLNLTNVTVLLTHSRDSSRHVSRTLLASSPLWLQKRTRTILRLNSRLAEFAYNCKCSCAWSWRLCGINTSVPMCRCT